MSVLISGTEMQTDIAVETAPITEDEITRYIRSIFPSSGVSVSSIDNPKSTHLCKDFKATAKGQTIYTTIDCTNMTSKEIAHILIDKIKTEIRGR